MAYIFIGKRIFFEKTNGNVILDTGEKEGWVIPTTPDEDIKNYVELQKYTKESIDFLDLQFGEFKTEFNECTSYRVNPTTKVLEFDYTPVPTPPDVPKTPSLHERVEKLEQTNAEQDLLISELAMI